MRILLDTHVFLWWIVDSEKLSKAARTAIAVPDNQVLLSSASVWEIAIKCRLGKLKLPDAAGVFVAKHLSRSSFAELPISIEHAVTVADLPDHHRDPFDRMLVAQARVESVPIVTGDAAIA